MRSGFRDLSCLWILAGGALYGWLCPESRNSHGLIPTKPREPKSFFGLEISWSRKQFKEVACFCLAHPILQELLHSLEQHYLSPGKERASNSFKIHCRGQLTRAEQKTPAVHRSTRRETLGLCLLLVAHPGPRFQRHGVFVWPSSGFLLPLLYIHLTWSSL